MTADRLRRLFSLFFVLVFFAYLFGPLIIMCLTAFNSSAFPRVAPWECFTVEWFSQLAADTRLLTGLRNSLFIGIGVVLTAVPLGLAAALMLMQTKERVRPWYYTLVISPILVPGVVLGISTLLFWDRLGTLFNASRDSIFYDGFFLTIVGQSTFISAYCMLIFISRLQRFEPAQEEAALDLGASHWQVFRRILLPFLKPAIASAAVLAFLASFENYNTTVFTAISTSTLTTVLASKVRYGIDPSISALAVVIVLVTLIGAAVHEVLKRRELARAAAAGAPPATAQAGDTRPVPRIPPPWFRDPALIMIALVVIAGVGTTVMAGTIGVDECRIAVKAEKQRQAQERIQALRERRQAAREAAGQAGDTDPAEQPADTDTGREPRIGTESFNSIFTTDNLGPAAGGEADDKPATIDPDETSSTHEPPADAGTETGSQEPAAD